MSNNKLKKLLEKKSKLAIGLLSGTSVDGIDAILIKISGEGTKTKIKVIDFITYSIPTVIKKAVLKNSDDKTAKLSEICRLNVMLGNLFADAAISFYKKNKLNAKQIDFIGSHGQTIHHLPNNPDYLGFNVKSTLQIGDPSVIAKRTDILTIGDFRTGDCAVGGDGAPLVPYLDFILFRSTKKNRALLNIGGISNITVLPKSCSKKDVIAFDTGPGNMLIDGLTMKLFGKKYDKDGKISGKGIINDLLLDFLLNEKYYTNHPPKSTGRERYGELFQKSILKRFSKLSYFDILRTVTFYTAFTIKYNYEVFIKKVTAIDELFISGGGVWNKVLVSDIKELFQPINIKILHQKGITADNKEAVLFAVLANECLSGNTTNMPSCTGSRKEVILGKICQ